MSQTSSTPVSTINNSVGAAAGANTPSVSGNDVRKIASKIVERELKKEAQELRKDFIAIFGLFGTLLTFVLIQVEAFIKASRMSMIVGVASFSFASLLLLVMCLNSVSKGKLTWREALGPVPVLIVIFLFFSFECFWWGIHGDFWWLEAFNTSNTEQAAEYKI